MVLILTEILMRHCAVGSSADELGLRHRIIKLQCPALSSRKTRELLEFDKKMVQISFNILMGLCTIGRFTDKLGLRHRIIKLQCPALSSRKTRELLEFDKKTVQILTEIPKEHCAFFFFLWKELVKLAKSASSLSSEHACVIITIAGVAARWCSCLLTTSFPKWTFEFCQFLMAIWLRLPQLIGLPIIYSYYSVCFTKSGWTTIDNHVLSLNTLCNSCHTTHAS